MCGILTILDLNGINILKAIKSLSILKKRGPDYTHYDIYNNLFIGQTTLEISGKYDKSNFFSESKNFTISFNGEIYNSKLSNDTKYLINMFDKKSHLEIIDEINGMYCFCVYNKIDNKLIIARDIIGEKFIYYYNKDGIFIVSSEILPIVNYIGKYNLNDNEFYNYFLTRHLMQFENTLFEDIYTVLPGESFILDISSLSIINRNIKDIRSLISEKKQNELANKNYHELNSILNDIFNKVVIEMTPKIDFACVISGGIDSSLSTALISKYKKPKVCVTCYCEDKDFVASKDMILYENSIKNKIDIINISSEEWANNITKCQLAFCSPLITHSSVNYNIMSNYIAKKKIKVLFVGDGADELFGGYDCYLNKNNEFNLYSPSNYSKIYDFKIKFLKNFSNQYKQKLSSLWEDSKKYYKDKIQSILLNDSLTMLSSVGCKTTDTIGSMNGLELRNIFYHKKILEFILNCPLSAKLDFEKNITKKLLKSAYLQFFPKSTIVKKQGFTGYPNESNYLIDNFKLITKLLKIKNYDNNDRDLMWKLINSEIFLKYTIPLINDYLK